MTNRSEERWPPADTLVEYLRDFAAEQDKAGKIHYNTTVETLNRDAPVVDAVNPGPITLRTRETHGGKTAEYICKQVIVATGIGTPNVPSDETNMGIDLATGYEDLPIDGRPFEGQAVLIWGQGNAALETADALAPYVNFVHIAPGRRSEVNFGEKDPHTLLSWESRYVGSARAINAGSFDAYLLKSLDSNSLGPDGSQSVLAKCGLDGKKFCVFQTFQTTIPFGFRKNVPLTYSLHDPWAVALVNGLIKRKLATHETRGSMGAPGKIDIGVSSGAANPHSDDTKIMSQGIIPDKNKVVMFDADALRDNHTLASEVMELARRAGSTNALVYDTVIRCLGWKHVPPFYSDTVRPYVQYNGKYPVMNSEYEAVGAPGMFYAGELGHGKDHLKSAGGFIHGFRYTVRALYRILEAANHLETAAGQWWPGQKTFENIGAEWTNKGTGLGPNGCNVGDYMFGVVDTSCKTPLKMQSQFEVMLNDVFARINQASGPYQMVALLGDGIVFRCDKAEGAKGGGGGGTVSNLRAEFMQEVPIEYFNARFDKLPRIVWHFGYEKQQQSLHHSRSIGTRFQVFIWYYPGDGGGDCAAEPLARAPVGTRKAVVREKELIRLAEELHTNWNSQEMRLRVGEWIQEKIGTILNPKQAIKAAKNAANSISGMAKDKANALTQKKDAMTECVATLPGLQQASAAACEKAADENCSTLKQKLKQKVVRCSMHVASQAAEKEAAAEAATRAGERADRSPLPLWLVQRDNAFAQIKWGEARESIEACIKKETMENNEPPPEQGENPLQSSAAISCAMKESAEWVGGKVELNVGNFCNQTIRLQRGSTLFFTQPAFRTIPDRIEAGRGKRFTAYERDIYRAIGFDGTVHAVWPVDVSNGVVQDLVVENCKEVAEETVSRRIS